MMNMRFHKIHSPIIDSKSGETTDWEIFSGIFLIWRSNIIMRTCGWFLHWRVRKELNSYKTTRHFTNYFYSHTRSLCNPVCYCYENPVLFVIILRNDRWLYVQVIDDLGWPQHTLKQESNKRHLQLPIRSKFCTCHDSWAVVICAKLGPDLSMKDLPHKSNTYLFSTIRFLLCGHETLSETGSWTWCSSAIIWTRRFMKNLRHLHGHACQNRTGTGHCFLCRGQ